MEKRYNDFNSALRAEFGCRVQKIPLDAGLSCPNRDGVLSSVGCIYCNAKGSGTGAAALGLSIEGQIKSAKEFLKRRYKAKKFIAYFQSYTNTYAPIEKLKALYDEALSDEEVVGMSVGTRPDCVDDDVLSLLQGYGNRRLVWIEYGLQSANDETLKKINRGHDLACFLDAINRTRNRGIRICAHMIIGLPGENRDDILKTADTIAGLGVDGVKLHLLYVVRKTLMEQLYTSGDYRCLDQKSYVEFVCDVLERLPSHMVIQRLTGDPHPQELAAPLWALKKRETFQLIQSRLAERNSWQGKCRDCQSSNPFT